MPNTHDGNGESPLLAWELSAISGHSSRASFVMAAGHSRGDSVFLIGAPQPDCPAAMHNIERDWETFEAFIAPGRADGGPSRPTGIRDLMLV